MRREDLNFVLQHSDIEKLYSLYTKIDKSLGVTIINQPTSQTLLVPIKDPVSDGEFYSGEVLVTSSIVSVNGNQGWSMVQDENKKLSIYIATLDAVFESKEFEEDIKDLYEQTIKKLEISNGILNQKVNSTRVSFDLM